MGHLRLFTIGAFCIVVAVMYIMAGTWFRSHRDKADKLLHLKRAGVFTFVSFILGSEITALCIGTVKSTNAWCGLVMLALGTMTFIWAWYANKSKPLTQIYANDTPQHLTTSGPYRFVRHPFYLSYLLLFSGGWVASGEHWFSAVFITALIFYIVAAYYEEKKFINSPLSELYLQYQQSTGLLLPRPVKWLRSRSDGL